jgi:hypothetical protein
MLSSGQQRVINGVEVPQDRCGLSMPIAYTPDVGYGQRVEGTIKIICHR